MAIETRSWAEVHQEARKTKGWSREVAAVRIGVSYSTVVQWEQGLKEPSLENFLRCADVYGWPQPLFERPRPDNRYFPLMDSDLYEELWWITEPNPNRHMRALAIPAPVAALAAS